MKKSLLLMAAAAMSMTAAAQTTFLYIDNEAAGITAETTITANTVLAQDDNMAIAIAFDEPVKPGGIKSIYPAFQVGGLDWDVTGGITGNNNPKGQTMVNAPTSGMVYKIDVKNDGWITIPSKLNLTKQYAVWEGTTSWVAYTIGGCGTSEAGYFYWTLPADDMGWVNFKSPEIGKYFAVDETGTATAIKKINEVDEALNGTGTEKNDVSGFIQFKAYKEAGTYYVCAYGSKMSMAGAFFTPGETQPTVVMSGAESGYTAVFGDASGVNDITVAPVLDENAPIYNVQGMKVNKDAKGILIQNGKKFVRF